MKSERSLGERDDPFLEALAQPGALCRADGVVQAANAAFRDLCGGDEVVGAALAGLFTGLEGLALADLGSADVEVRPRSGPPLVLRLSRRGDAIAVLSVLPGAR